jgi:hypothetical protein
MEHSLRNSCPQIRSGRAVGGAIVAGLLLLNGCASYQALFLNSAAVEKALRPEEGQPPFPRPPVWLGQA